MFIYRRPYRILVKDINYIGFKLTSSILLLKIFLACARWTGASKSGCSAFTSTMARQYFPCTLTILPVSNLTLARTPKHWSKSPNCMPLPCNKPEGIFAVASSTVMKNSTFVQLCKPFGNGPQTEMEHSRALICPLCLYFLWNHVLKRILWLCQLLLYTFIQWLVFSVSLHTIWS